MKTWKRFAHVNAKTIDEAASILRAGKPRSFPEAPIFWAR